MEPFNEFNYQFELLMNQVGIQAYIQETDNFYIVKVYNPETVLYCPKEETNTPKGLFDKIKKSNPELFL